MFSMRHPREFLASDADQKSFQLADVRELAAPDQLAGRVDRKLAVRGPPSADRIEVLQGEAQRVHLLVARGAFGLRPVKLHPLAQRGGFGGLLAFIQLGDFGRGRGGRRPEKSAARSTARASRAMSGSGLTSA